MTDPQFSTPSTDSGASAFDAIKHTDDSGQEYWLARELATLLGYVKWQHFHEVIKEAMIASASQGYVVQELFTEAGKKSTGGRPALDYRLTRMACYMTALSADGNKTEVAAAKTYFAVMTREREELLDLAYQLGENPLTEIAQRIVRRQELTEANKRLLARARDAGVITPEQCARFMNWGYRGLYAGETEDDIHSRKQLVTRERISDWMGALETMANVLRAVVADRRMERQGAQTADDANQTHYDAGKTVRGWLTSEGIYPEALPTPTKSYKQIVKEEAARIAREEEDEAGLWGQLPSSNA